MAVKKQMHFIVANDYEREISEYISALNEKTGLPKSVLVSCVLAYGLREISKNLKLDINIAPSKEVNIADFLHQ